MPCCSVLLSSGTVPRTDLLVLPCVDLLLLRLPLILLRLCRCLFTLFPCYSLLLPLRVTLFLYVFVVCWYVTLFPLLPLFVCCLLPFLVVTFVLWCCSTVVGGGLLHCSAFGSFVWCPLLLVLPLRYWVVVLVFIERRWCGLLFCCLRCCTMVLYGCLLLLLLFC